MRGHLVVIDIGNTSTSLGLYTGGRVSKMERLPTAIRDPHTLDTRLKHVVGRGTPAGVALASVVPRATRGWRQSARRLWPRAEVLPVHHRLNLGVGIDYPRPQTIGADRLCNACAAVARYGAPVIVADFGTAVTFDVISADRKYIGGVIAPGLPLMFTYLAEKTALLPRVEWGRVKHGVGKNTVEAMRLGAIWGYRGLVREIFKELGKRLDGLRITYCATGGYASRVLRGSGLPVRVDEDLTLYGLGRIYELNRADVSLRSGPKVGPGFPPEAGLPKAESRPKVEPGSRRL